MCARRLSVLSNALYKSICARSLVFVFVAGVAVFGFSGCGYSYETGGGKPAAAVESTGSSDVLSAPEIVDALDAEAPTIINSGWWAKDSYVHYGVKVRNPNEAYVAHNVAVHVILKGESGNTMYESTDFIPEIGPGETVGFAGTSGDGWAPTTVDIELIDDGTTYYDAVGYMSPFAITSVEEKDMGEFRYELIGKVANNTESYVSTVDLHTLLLDSNGNIAAGYNAESYKIKPGQTKNFTHTINSAPDHTSVEVYAQPRY